MEVANGEYKTNSNLELIRESDVNKMARRTDIANGPITARVARSVSNDRPVRTTGSAMIISHRKVIKLWKRLKAVRKKLV